MGRVAAAAVVASLAAAAPASARCVNASCQILSSQSVDPIKPPDFNNLPIFSRVGEQFTYSAAANLFQASNGGVVAYSSPFSLNVGSGLTSALFIKEDGVVAIGRSLASGGFTQVADLSGLGVPLIAPFYADLNQNSRTAIAAGYAGIIIQQGIADPFTDASGAYALADAKAALRITWFGFDVANAAGGTAPVYSQLLLIDEGNGDFDFKIRAGSPDSPMANSPGGGIGGFVFAQDSDQYATPYTSSSAGTFSVRGGQVVALTSSVPEPGAWGLILLGFGIVGAGLRRRGRRQANSGARRPDGAGASAVAGRPG